MQKPSKQFPRSSICALAVIMCLLGSGNAAGAQSAADVRSRMTVPDSAHLQIVTLTDGSTIFGRIVTVGADTVAFQTGAGTMQLSVKAIRDIRQISSEDVREGDRLVAALRDREVGQIAGRAIHIVFEGEHVSITTLPGNCRCRLKFHCWITGYAMDGSN